MSEFHLDMQLLNVVDRSDGQAVFTRQRQTVGELAGVEGTHRVHLQEAIETVDCA